MKILKTIAALFIALSLNTISVADEYKETINNQVKNSLSVENAQTKDTSNQVLCVLTGSENAKHVNNIAVREYGASGDLNCIGTDEYATYSTIFENNITYLFMVIIGIMVGIYFVMYLIKSVFNTNEQQSRLPSLKTFSLSLAISLLLVIPVSDTKINGVQTKTPIISMLVVSGWKESTLIANAILEKYLSFRSYFFAEVQLPHFNNKADVMESVFDFLLSASASNKNADILLTAVEAEGNIVVESYSGQYKGQFVLGYDKEAVDIAKRNGLLDYRAFIIDRQKTALESTMLYMQGTVENFGISINKTSDKHTFKMNDYDCSVLPTMDLKTFTRTSLATNYKKKAAMCGSELYLTEMYKFKGFENKEYLDNKNYLNNRKLEVCVHTNEFSNKIYSRDEVKEKAKQCIEDACGATGSPFWCSAAIRIDDKFKTTKSEDLADIFEMAKYFFLEFGIDETKSGQIFGNKFYFDYSKSDNDYIINTVAPSLFKINLKTTGKAQFIETTLSEKFWMFIEDASNEIFGMDFGQISIEKLTKELFTFGNDGFLGVDKLNACLKYPNQYLIEEKYKCAGNFTENITHGREVFYTSVNLLAYKFFLNFKTGKTKEVAAGEIKQLSKMAGKVLGSKGIRAALFIAGESMVNDIHNPALKDANTMLENTALYTAIYFSESFGGFLNKVLYFMLVYGFVLYYLIPMMLFYYILKAQGDLIINLAVYLKTAPLQVINSFASGKHKAPNLDLPDWLVYGVMITLSPVIFVISFTVVDVLLKNGMAYLPDMFLGYLSGASELKGGIFALEEFMFERVVYLIFVYLYFKLLASVIINLSIYANLFTFNQGNVDFSGESALQDNIENDRISNKFWKS